MTNKWNYLPLTSEQELISKTLEERYPQCPTICKLLAQRGVTSVAETEKFFKPLMSDLHDPFLMKDMHKAVN
ncbi:MAG: single-stranded-DNA-specific exonuclease RecJ, partial [Bacteroidaceae bacterium]|nr:single-stranded-DNA-specific exonuclease RecJ [Bacteroidaceae bacterium]